VIATDKEDFCEMIAALHDKCTVPVKVAEAADIVDKEED
jgi:siroheme synthase (precorrin-2 oxidase/ferrochelatase)